MKATDEGIEEALGQVRKLIERVVRAEQLRDQLTGLPNDAALTSGLSAALGNSEAFWVAFVEIDHFKRVNEEFGYDLADGLLKKVAAHLQHAQDYFAGSVVAFRAHGDEFYLLGGLEEDDEHRVADALETVRASLAAIRIPVPDRDNVLSCTVSVGWATSLDGGDERLTPRRFKLLLEHAVGAAKRGGRNRVIRFDESVRKQQIHGVRDNCQTCQSSFTVDVPVGEIRDGPLSCPNCRAEIPRPPPPAAPPVVITLKSAPK